MDPSTRRRLTEQLSKLSTAIAADLHPQVFWADGLDQVEVDPEVPTVQLGLGGDCGAIAPPERAVATVEPSRSRRGHRQAQVDDTDLGELEMDVGEVGVGEGLAYEQDFDPPEVALVVEVDRHAARHPDGLRHGFVGKVDVHRVDIRIVRGSHVRRSRMRTRA